MHNHIKRFAGGLLVAGAVVVVGGCNNFLTGGETSTDPNRQVQATNDQFFVATQETLWAYWGSDPARLTGILAQQFHGVANQYGALEARYSHDPSTTNGTHSAIYTGGGLVDIKKLQTGARQLGDSLYVGIAQIEEGALMGTGADLFGDLVYKQALQGIPNPTLDDQLSVYDSVQKVISAGIANVNSNVATNVGPGGADLVYGGDTDLWTAFAHTLKARFYMHTAEVRPGAYAQALAEAQKGISSDAGNYVGAFTSTASETNFYFQFHGPAGRGGDLAIGNTLDTILVRRGDPREAQYFAASGNPRWLSATRGAANFQQPYVTYDENTLIWAEAAYRTGDQVTALAKLNEERANHGLAPEVVAGQALLNEILTEKYIVDFQLGEEAWNDYKRTCTPNLVPTAPAGTPIPGRLYYDASEQNTDTNIPAPGTGSNTLRNKNDPPNAVSDGTGAACLGQF